MRALSTLHARRWHGRIEVAVMTLAWSISVTVDALDAGGACALMKRGGAGVLPVVRRGDDVAMRAAARGSRCGERSPRDAARWR